MQRLKWLLPLTAALLFSAGLWVLTAAPASAQCGSQASSCKNCHEVQAKAPVNAKGDWHVQHNFADYCANCHAGNVQATDEGGAHAGMLAPLSDINANCAGCHPDDTSARAQKYATILGVTLGAAGTPGAPGNTAPQGNSGDSGNSAGGGAATAVPATGGETGVVVNEADAIDYNQAPQGSAINWGDVTLAVLIVALLAGGGGFVYLNERRLRAPAQPAPAGAPRIVPLDQYPPEALALLPGLACLSPAGLHALATLLEDPDVASEFLRGLSRLDPELVHRVHTLDRESRALLLAIAAG